MSYTIYSLPGCTRCKILKQCMSEQGLAYTEKDTQADGKEEFQKFYSQNRKSIFRGSVGIEFPILASSEGIWQGLPKTLAQILFGKKLNGFVRMGCTYLAVNRPMPTNFCNCYIILRTTTCNCK